MADPVPIAVVDAVDHEARLKHERVRDRRVVLRVRVLDDVENPSGSCSPRLKVDEAGVRDRLIDLDQSQDAVDVVLKPSGGCRTFPTIVFPDGGVLVESKHRELLQALGRPLPSARHYISRRARLLQVAGDGYLLSP